jgi:hypothetical protein
MCTKGLMQRPLLLLRLSAVSHPQVLKVIRRSQSLAFNDRISGSLYLGLNFVIHRTYHGLAFNQPNSPPQYISATFARKLFPSPG